MVEKHRQPPIVKGVAITKRVRAPYYQKCGSAMVDTFSDSLEPTVRYVIHSDNSMHKICLART